jgi:hypothetical protein
MDAHPQRKTASLASSHLLGLASLLLASLALIAASIPYLRLASLPMSGLGFLLGIVGAIIPSSESGRKPGIPLPLVGGTLNLIVFLLAGFWLGQFDIILGGLRKTPVVEQKSVPLHNAAVGTFRAGGDWVDASQDAIQFGDVRIRLVSATVGTVELKDSKGKKRPSEKCLIIKVRVSNAGAERVVQFDSWYKPVSLTEKSVPLLHDNRGKLYSLKAFPPDVEVVGRVTQVTLPPGKKVEDVLIFKELPEKVEFLRLELPATAFGSTDRLLRLQIPRRMIQGR